MKIIKEILPSGQKKIVSTYKIDLRNFSEEAVKGYFCTGFTIFIDCKGLFYKGYKYSPYIYYIGDLISLGIFLENEL